VGTIHSPGLNSFRYCILFDRLVACFRISD